MLDRFRNYSGGVYAHPRVAVHVDDGRSFIRRSTSRYDVIQASLVDTWAATAAGAYTLTGSLYTTEAFGEYIDHLTDDGLLSITRWVFDGLRLVTLAQEACAARGLDAAQHLAIVRKDRVATFLLKRQPFTQTRRVCSASPTSSSSRSSTHLELCPAPLPLNLRRWTVPARVSDYRELILAPDRERFLASYPIDIRPTTDDRPFFFHTTRLRDQLNVAFGRSMLFGQAERIADPDWHLGLAGRALCGRSAARRRSAPSFGLEPVARLLRFTRRGVHAARSRAVAAIRAAARASCVFADRDVVFASRGHRHRKLHQPPRRSRTPQGRRASRTPWSCSPCSARWRSPSSSTTRLRGRCRSDWSLPQPSSSRPVFSSACHCRPGCGWSQRLDRRSFPGAGG